MRRAIILSLAVLSSALPGGVNTMSPAGAQEAGRCGQAAFAAVVGESGAALTAMNDEKRRAFTEKLQALKAQEQWSDASYAANARPYVQDEKIAAFDATGRTLLARVQGLGGGDSLTDEARCALLGELKGLLAHVVANTRDKWDYMFAKLGRALKPGATSPAPQTVSVAK